MPSFGSIAFLVAFTVSSTPSEAMLAFSRGTARCVFTSARPMSPTPSLGSPLMSSMAARNGASYYEEDLDEHAFKEHDLFAGLASASQIPMHQVIFVRHGQSTWNKANRFIGWTDTELTEEGEREARAAGRILIQQGIEFDVVHTSMLKRSVKTAWLILEEMGMEHIPVNCHWRLNERSYGALVGRNKKECVAEHGADQVKLWRRSYDVRPPAQSVQDKFWPGHQKGKYSNFLFGDAEIPLAESLRDVKLRAVKHWEEEVTKSIKEGQRVLVVGHENNLRSLLMHLDGISKEDVLHLEIPRAVPILYQFDAAMQPIRQPQAAPLISGQYMLNQEKLEAIKERDMRQVYDLSIKMNLETVQLDEAMAVCHHTKGETTKGDRVAPSSLPTHQHHHRSTSAPEPSMYILNQQSSSSPSLQKQLQQPSSSSSSQQGSSRRHRIRQRVSRFVRSVMALPFNEGRLLGGGHHQSPMALGLATDTSPIMGGKNNLLSTAVVPASSSSLPSSPSSSAAVTAAAVVGVPGNEADGSWSREKALFYLRHG